MSVNVNFFVFACIICLVAGYNNNTSNIITGYNNTKNEVPGFEFRQMLNQQFTIGAGRGLNSICTGNIQGAQVQGVCRPVGECQLRGGTIAGTCTPAGLCCVFERSCFNTENSNAKLSYFVTPQTFQTQCGLTVTTFNRDVCQIRLDFDRFSIGQPTSPSIIFTNSSYQCNNDSFTVASANNNLGFVHLCGENTGQHIYVPVNGASSIILNFQFAGDRTSIQPFIPNWRIRITQLECVSSTQNRPPSINAQRDAALIAPNGCLQYYTERMGTYESFNYNNGVGPYIGRTSYAVCFQRAQDVCGIRHIPVQFNMNFNVDNNGQLICRPDPIGNAQANQDYMYIPGGIVNGRTPREYFCNSDLNSSSSVTSSAPSTLYVAVRTDSIAQVGRRESGFRFNYQVLSTGCIYRKQ